MRHRVEGCTIGVAQSLANSAEEMVCSGGNKREQGVVSKKKWAAFIRDLGHFFYAIFCIFAAKLFLFVKKQLNLQSKKK